LKAADRCSGIAAHAERPVHDVDRPASPDWLIDCLTRQPLLSTRGRMTLTSLKRSMTRDTEDNLRPRSLSGSRRTSACQRNGCRPSPAAVE